MVNYQVGPAGSRRPARKLYGEPAGGFCTVAKLITAGNSMHHDSPPNWKTYQLSKEALLWWAGMDVRLDILLWKMDAGDSHSSCICAKFPEGFRKIQDLTRIKVEGSKP